MFPRRRRSNRRWRQERRSERVSWVSTITSSRASATVLENGRITGGNPIILSQRYSQHIKNPNCGAPNESQERVKCGGSVRLTVRTPTPATRHQGTGLSWPLSLPGRPPLCPGVYGRSDSRGLADGSMPSNVLLSERRPMAIWEYRIEQLLIRNSDNPESTELRNEWFIQRGLDGWELVNVVDIHEEYEVRTVGTAIFKRPQQ